jgi:hypothetical protein
MLHPSSLRRTVSTPPSSGLNISRWQSQRTRRRDGDRFIDHSLSRIVKLNFEPAINSCPSRSGGFWFRPRPQRVCNRRRSYSPLRIAKARERRPGPKDAIYGWTLGSLIRNGQANHAARESQDGWTFAVERSIFLALDPPTPFFPTVIFFTGPGRKMPFRVGHWVLTPIAFSYSIPAPAAPFDWKEVIF